MLAEPGQTTAGIEVLGVFVVLPNAQPEDRLAPFPALFFRELKELLAQAPVLETFLQVDPLDFQAVWVDLFVLGVVNVQLQVAVNFPVRF